MNTCCAVRRMFRDFSPHAVILVCIVAACSARLHTDNAAFAASPVVHIFIGIFILFIHSCMNYIFFFLYENNMLFALLLFYLFHSCMSYGEFHESV